MSVMPNQVRKFLIKFWKGLACPKSQELISLATEDRWAEIQKLRVNPTHYSCATAYRHDAYAVEIVRKLLLPGDTASRKEAAVATFWAAEAQCAATNRRLSRFVERGPFEAADLAVDDFINRWRREVKRVLGNRPTLNLTPHFSKGSTLSDSGKLTTIPDKMSSTLTAYKSTDLSWFVLTPWAENGPAKIVRGNRFFTVPKDSQKDRGCCVEASANIALQLNIGKEIRRLYNRAYQVDLEMMQQQHRVWAQQGSAGHLRIATIDLSNASDTVARELVKLLLPASWWRLLNSLRATHTEIDGKTVYLEKFSSMGNGFTFELETLIYRSMMQALGCGLDGTPCSAYGDDMICGEKYATDVMAALKFFGFQPNKEKTFCEGPFRESCGGDYFDGEPVRAHYMKELPDEPQKWIALANGIRRIDHHGRLNAAWWFCVEQVPVDLRNFGPDTLGDTLFHVDDPQPTYRMWRTRETQRVRTPAGETRWRKVTVDHHYLPYYRCYVPVNQKFSLGRYWSYRVATAAASLGCPPEITPRDSVSGYVLRWVQCPSYGRGADYYFWSED